MPLSKGMLVKRSILGPLEWWIHYDVASLLSNDVTDVHAIRDGLNAAPDHLNQVLENQSWQIDLVACLDLVHEPVVNLVHRSMLRPYGSEKCDINKCRSLSCSGRFGHYH